MRQRSGPIARQILSILFSCHHDHDAKESHDADHGGHVHDDCDDAEDDDDDDDIGQYLWGLGKEFVQVQNKNKKWFVDSTKFSILLI